MIKKLKHKYIQQMLIYSEIVNRYTPFPLHDTEYVNKLKTMTKDINEYNDEPVVACKHCKSLHIILDDENNNVCHRCGSYNELIVIDDIEEYDRKYGHIWKIVHPTIIDPPKYIMGMDPYTEDNEER